MCQTCVNEIKGCQKCKDGYNLDHRLACVKEKLHTALPDGSNYYDRLFGQLQEQSRAGENVLNAIRRQGDG